MNDEIIAAGRTAELYGYGEENVIKLFKPGISLDMLNMEYINSSEVYRSGIATPQPVRKIELNGRIGIVYEKVSGETLLTLIMKKLASVQEAAAKMVYIHKDIHQKSIPKLPKQKGILAEKIGDAPSLTTFEKTSIIAYLVGLEEDTKVLHGDFHPDNIIIGEKEWTIDWMTGMSGHPAGDVARTIILLQYGTLPEEVPKQVAAYFSHIRMQMLHDYTSRYLGETSISHEEIDRWLLPVAAARLCEWIPDAEKERLVKLIRERLV
ncbi:phosphotransferase family protein [Paenibacillus tarimensis]